MRMLSAAAAAVAANIRFIFNNFVIWKITKSWTWSLPCPAFCSRSERLGSWYSRLVGLTIDVQQLKCAPFLARSRSLSLLFYSGTPNYGMACIRCNKIIQYVFAKVYHYVIIVAIAFAIEYARISQCMVHGDAVVLIAGQLIYRNACQLCVQ